MMKLYMKKTYTKKQIAEAIAYWKVQLKAMNEDVNTSSMDDKIPNNSKFLYIYGDNVFNEPGFKVLTKRGLLAKLKSNDLYYDENNRDELNSVIDDLCSGKIVKIYAFQKGTPDIFYSVHRPHGGNTTILGINKIIELNALNRVKASDY